MSSKNLLPPSSQAPIIILVRPQLAENIGMCARAMANFGLNELRLVAPRDGWPQKTRMKKGAISASAGAHKILEEARFFPDLASALGDLTQVYATTARNRELAKPVYAPDQAMEQTDLALKKGEKIGFLFGPERTGLDNADIALASNIITFPVNPAFASLNLAQAVLLVGYEWFRVHNATMRPEKIEGDVLGSPLIVAPAKRETLFAFFDFVEGHLDRAKFFWPPTKRAIMVRNFRALIQRINPSEQDIRTLRGAITWLVRRGARAPSLSSHGVAKDKNHGET